MEQIANRRRIWGYDEAVDRDEEELEEIFAHIWAVQKLNLVQSRRIHPEDCLQVSRDQRVEGIPHKLSFSRDILVQAKATYADILKRSALAEGGRWVWQANMPPLQRGNPFA
jgi:hypothetical protein